MATLAMLCETIRHWPREELMKQSGHSRSQWYEWLKEGAQERKDRPPRLIPRSTAQAAVELIMKYPHFSALKGQAYMIYHRLGYVPHHVYKNFKAVTQRVIFQEVERGKLLPARNSYEHVRPRNVGEIWAEDFTQVRVYGQRFYAALVMDVYSDYYLGIAAQRRAGDSLVASPLAQAMEENNGKAPSGFLVSDNGKQYISDEHGQQLDALQIIQKRIPPCRPQYNGSVECGCKEFKNVFYSLWAAQETAQADKEKSLDERVAITVEHTRMRLNHEIPRPCLGGVTPADVHRGIAAQKKAENQRWEEMEKERAGKEAKPWGTTIWQLVRDTVTAKSPSRLYLLTMFCFFLRRPLRKLANLVHGVLGEFSQLSSGFP